ncbi:hypothetical protein 2 [Rhabdoviridae sp.]|uniref:Uncharacterized protein n=1 Tax=Rattus tanezumi rhabdovirus 1 TaxID=3071238 RepID=A0A858HQS9_9RHAB|nr:hypothetical protein 2 [Rhabdoviridae sp.]QIM74103.1 hypothetical protein 2 [Rattus tanezumi rhabdovirus 1]
MRKINITHPMEKVWQIVIASKKRIQGLNQSSTRIGEVSDLLTPINTTPIRNESYSSERGKFHYSIEVESQLIVQTSQMVSLRQLIGHLHQHLKAYTGELLLFKIHHLILCLNVRLIQHESVNSSSIYMHRYSAQMTTVLSLSSFTSLDRLFRAGTIRARSSWDSAGIGYKTKWLFTSSIKQTTVPGIVVSIKMLPELEELLRNSSISNDYTTEGEVMVFY